MEAKAPSKRSSGQGGAGPRTQPWRRGKPIRLQSASPAVRPQESGSPSLSPRLHPRRRDSSPCRAGFWQAVARQCVWLCRVNGTGLCTSSGASEASGAVLIAENAGPQQGHKVPLEIRDKQDKSLRLVPVAKTPSSPPKANPPQGEGQFGVTLTTV